MLGIVDVVVGSGWFVSKGWAGDCESGRWQRCESNGEWRPPKMAKGIGIGLGAYGLVSARIQMNRGAVRLN